MRWLAQVELAARTDCGLAIELAECQRLVRGYGSTYERGLRNFRSILDRAQELVGNIDAAPTIASWRSAALADEQGDLLAAELAAARPA